MLVVVRIKLECRYATTDDEEENVSHDVTPFGPKTLEHKTKKTKTERLSQNKDQTC